MQLDNKVDELIAFIKNWKEDCRQELGLPSSNGATIGLSFDPDFRLNSVPNSDPVSTGFYQTSHNNIIVEVTNHSFATDIVTFDVVKPDSVLKRSGSMTSDLFNLLFEEVHDHEEAKGLVEWQPVHFVSRKKNWLMRALEWFGK